jgi:hypothetical protein
MKLRWMNDDEPLRVDWPVTIDAPANDGEVDSQTVTMRFEIIGADEAQKLLTPSDETLLGQLSRGVDADTTVDFLRRVVVGWNQVDVGLPFSPEALDKLIRFPFARTCVFKAYGQAAQGRKAKN